MQRTWQTSEPLRRLHGLPMEIDERLDEFSYIDASLVAGMDAEARRPQAEAYWARCDVGFRMGASADTFLEFAARVDSFLESMADFPESTVVFGHGLWTAMLAWRMACQPTDSSQAMAAFRRFQQGLGVKNASVHVASLDAMGWGLGMLGSLAAPHGAAPREVSDAAGPSSNDQA